MTWKFPRNFWFMSSFKECKGSKKNFNDLEVLGGLIIL
jgi:hypothetical protein